jgi:hypothetical protein
MVEESSPSASAMDDEDDSDDYDIQDLAERSGCVYGNGNHSTATGSSMKESQQLRRPKKALSANKPN